MTTDLKILHHVIDTLDNIDIPAKYVEKIGIPVSNCSRLLEALTKAIEETIRKKQAEEQAQATAEPVSEPVAEEWEPVAEEWAPEEEVLPFEEPAEN